MDAKHCRGCRDDFYNHNDMGLNMGSGRPQCWSLANATREKRLLIHMDQRPPYDKKDARMLPTCYRAQRHVNVKPEALDDKGYWR